MEETGGLMAPIPTRSAADWKAEEERRKRAMGWGGLLTSVAEPVSYVPGPIGDVAEIASNVGREGLMQGLLSSWNVIGLPKVLRKGPAVMSIAKRVDPKTEAMIKALKGKIQQEALKETGSFIGLDQVPLKEIPSTGAGLTKQAAADLARLGQTEGPLGAVLEHPRFFEEIPKAKEVYTSLKQVPRGEEGSKIRGSFQPGEAGNLIGGGKIELASSAPQGTPYDLLGGLLHEGAHVAQVGDRRTYGTSPGWIRQNIELEYGDKLPKDPEARSAVVARIASILYGVNLGEREAFASQRRRFLPAGMNETRPFNEDVLSIGQPAQKVIDVDRLVRTPPWSSPGSAWPAYKPEVERYLKEFLSTGP